MNGLDYKKIKNQKLELVPTAEQPRFVNVVYCKYTKILGEDRNFYILTFTIDKYKYVPVNINEAHIEAIETMEHRIECNIVVGNFGAQVADDRDEKEAYYFLNGSGCPTQINISGILFAMLIIYILSGDHQGGTQLFLR